VVGGVLLALVALAALAQKPGSDKSIRFGDVVLSGFETAQLELGVRATASGPGTQVKAVDPDRKTTAQLWAREIVAFMVREKDAKGAERAMGRVSRITADGNVRFHAVRPTEQGSGTQTVQATGTRAIFDRANQQLTLSGPVTFSAEQPDAANKGTDKVTGRAARAIYDEGKRVLQLLGDVEATVVTPDTPPEGSTFTGDEVRIEMAQEPYRVTILNPSLKGSVNLKIQVPEKDEKKEQRR
jgi:lipopolysaccharide export system protein LptA